MFTRALGLELQLFQVNKETVLEQKETSRSLLCEHCSPPGAFFFDAQQNSRKSQKGQQQKSISLCLSKYLKVLFAEEVQQVPPTLQVAKNLQDASDCLLSDHPFFLDTRQSTRNETGYYRTKTKHLFKKLLQ